MRSPWKVAGAALTIAAVTASMAGIAAADPVTGTLLDPSKTGNAEVVGFRVHLHNADNTGTKDVTPYLLRLKLSDGTELKVYCVGVNINASYDNGAMTEASWDNYPDAGSPFKANSKKINWVLHHGYPNVSLADLNNLGLATNADGIEVEEAVTATQAALWHFSDGYTIDRTDPLFRGNHDSDKDVLALYDYLTGDKNTGVDETPVGDLAINPGSKHGAAGDLIGPFTVTTNGTVDSLTTDLPNGVEVTDKDGKTLTAADIKNGTKFYVKVPAGAPAVDAKTVTLGGKSPVREIGRLFTGTDGKTAQPLIVAGSDTKPLSAQAKVDWTVKSSTTTTTPTTTTVQTSPLPTTTVAPTTTTVAPAPQPSNNLPNTGASILLPVLVGLGLLGGGAGALLYLRHRRRAA
ncbi:thioester domain-containing protein [Actinokineospora inagensis]|uniref:thioester domain-containing protein n=1 Tax=Actinokineospora inagensis TaxID=103730 RepID=UPI000A073968|nr:thioester domain-containing protein [Actinokineospora inagensis]